MSAENRAYENDVPVTSFSTTVDDDPYEEVQLGFEKVDVESSVGSSQIPKPYAGMPKEILLHYSRRRHFVWARNILTGAVILTILILFSMVIALIAVSPACQYYWQTSPIYQVYPKSFRDSDNDGTGDLKGIQEKLDYFENLGVTTIWLNPVYKSPQKDNGYDVEDYRDIDPLFGTLQDMEDLINEMHNRGMKIIMDFVPNHSSDQHQWFNASSNPNHPDHETFKDYYIWVNSTNGTSAGTPNNWQSVFSDVETSAWEWNENRQQFYYHAFYKEQPDLNLRNPAVQQELKDIFSYWVDLGVDGFRCDAVGFMLEATHLRDNPVVDPTKPLSYENVYPDYTENQMGIHDIVADWKVLLKKGSSEPGVYRFMETEVYDDVDVVTRYYGTEIVQEADLAMNFLFIDLGSGSQWTGTSVESTVLSWMRNMPSGRWPNWVIGNHDNSRVVTRLGEQKAKLAAVLTLTLSGTPGIYYGEEIGMMNNPNVSDSDFRNPERTPMQWSAEVNAGFCSNCTPWLDVSDTYETAGLNVKDLSNANDQTSMLNLYKYLIQLRSDVTFVRGTLCMLYATDQMIAFVREMPGTESKLVLINFDLNNQTRINLRDLFPNLPVSGSFVFSSLTGQSGEQVMFDSVDAEPGEAKVVQFKVGGNANLFNKQSNMADRCFTAKKVCVNVLGLLEMC
ncbi:amino acid transporter heavy chain SLC3A1-like [Clavelina lepadiformis]|uniref:amino acid transporter heavy chain SLC3A1-like n=1 Tax=Clavelina lepadiformis TaxID=159417 RepID=UPI0040414298